MSIKDDLPVVNEPTEETNQISPEVAQYIEQTSAAIKANNAAAQTGFAQRSLNAVEQNIPQINPFMSISNQALMNRQSDQNMTSQELIDFASNPILREQAQTRNNPRTNTELAKDTWASMRQSAVNLQKQYYGLNRRLNEGDVADYNEKIAAIEGRKDPKLDSHLARMKKAREVAVAKAAEAKKTYEELDAEFKSINEEKSDYAKIQEKFTTEEYQRDIASRAEEVAIRKKIGDWTAMDSAAEFGKQFTSTMSAIIDRPAYAVDLALQSSADILISAGSGWALSGLAKTAAGAAKLATATGITTTMAQEAMSNAGEVVHHLDKLSNAQLEKDSPYYRDLVENEGMNPIDARNKLATATYDMTAIISAAVAGTASAVTGSGAMVGNLFRPTSRLGQQLSRTARDVPRNKSGDIDLRNPADGRIYYPDDSRVIRGLDADGKTATNHVVDKDGIVLNRAEDGKILDVEYDKVTGRIRTTQSTEPDAPNTTKVNLDEDGAPKATNTPDELPEPGTVGASLKWLEDSSKKLVQDTSARWDTYVANHKKTAMAVKALGIPTKLATKAVYKTGVNRFTKSTAKGFTTEFFQEGIESFGGQLAQNIAKQMYLNENQAIDENLGPNTALGMAAGGIMGGTINAVQSPYAAISASREVKRAQKELYNQVIRSRAATEADVRKEFSQIIEDAKVSGDFTRVVDVANPNFKMEEAFSLLEERAKGKDVDLAENFEVMNKLYNDYAIRHIVATENLLNDPNENLSDKERAEYSATLKQHQDILAKIYPRLMEAQKAAHPVEAVNEAVDIAVETATNTDPVINEAGELDSTVATEAMTEVMNHVLANPSALTPESAKKILDLPNLSDADRALIESIARWNESSNTLGQVADYVINGGEDEDGKRWIGFNEHIAFVTAQLGFRNTNGAIENLQAFSDFVNQRRRKADLVTKAAALPDGPERDGYLEAAGLMTGGIAKPLVEQIVQEAQMASEVYEMLEAMVVRAVEEHGKTSGEIIPGSSNTTDDNTPQEINKSGLSATELYNLRLTAGDVQVENQGVVYNVSPDNVIRHPTNPNARIKNIKRLRRIIHDANVLRDQVLVSQGKLDPDKALKLEDFVESGGSNTSQRVHTVEDGAKIIDVDGLKFRVLTNGIIQPMQRGAVSRDLLNKVRELAKLAPIPDPVENTEGQFPKSFKGDYKYESYRGKTRDIEYEGQMYTVRGNGYVTLASDPSVRVLPGVSNTLRRMANELAESDPKGQTDQENLQTQGGTTPPPDAPKPTKISLQNALNDLIASPSSKAVEALLGALRNAVLTQPKRKNTVNNIVFDRMAANVPRDIKIKFVEEGTTDPTEIKFLERGALGAAVLDSNTLLINKAEWTKDPDPNTIYHELDHLATAKHIEKIAKDNTPEYQELVHIWKELKNAKINSKASKNPKVRKVLDYILGNLEEYASFSVNGEPSVDAINEMITMTKTQPEFRKFMQERKYKASNQSLFDKLVSLLASFFGFTPSQVRMYTAVMMLSDVGFKLPVDQAPITPTPPPASTPTPTPETSNATPPPSDRVEANKKTIYQKVKDTMSNAISGMVTTVSTKALLNDEEKDIINSVAALTKAYVDKLLDNMSEYDDMFNTALDYIYANDPVVAKYLNDPNSSKKVIAIANSLIGVADVSVKLANHTPYVVHGSGTRDYLDGTFDVLTKLPELVTNALSSAKTAEEHQAVISKVHVVVSQLARDSQSMAAMSATAHYSQLALQEGTASITTSVHRLTEAALEGYTPFAPFGIPELGIPAQSLDQYLDTGKFTTDWGPNGYASLGTSLLAPFNNLAVEDFLEPGINPEIIPSISHYNPPATPIAATGQATFSVRLPDDRMVDFVRDVDGSIFRPAIQDMVQGGAIEYTPEILADIQAASDRAYQRIQGLVPEQSTFAELANNTAIQSNNEKLTAVYGDTDDFKGARSIDTDGSGYVPSQQLEVNKPQPSLFDEPVISAPKQEKEPEWVNPTLKGSGRANQHLPKDQAKSDAANKFIGFGAPNTSTEEYQSAWGERANTGEYTADDKVFLSTNGNVNKENAAATKTELMKAIQAGASIITDNPANRQRKYNAGERQMAEFLKSKGYAETIGDQYSTWVPAKKDQVPPKPELDKLANEFIDTALNEGMDAQTLDTAVTDIKGLKALTDVPQLIQNYRNSNDNNFAQAANILERLITPKDENNNQNEQPPINPILRPLPEAATLTKAQAAEVAANAVVALNSVQGVSRETLDIIQGSLEKARNVIDLWVLTKTLGVKEDTKAAEQPLVDYLSGLGYDLFGPVGTAPTQPQTTFVSDNYTPDQMVELKSIIELHALNSVSAFLHDLEQLDYISDYHKVWFNAIKNSPFAMNTQVQEISDIGRKGGRVAAHMPSAYPHSYILGQRIMSEPGNILRTILHEAIHVPTVPALTVKSADNIPEPFQVYRADMEAVRDKLRSIFGVTARVDVVATYLPGKTPQQIHHAAHYINYMMSRLAEVPTVALSDPLIIEVLRQIPSTKPRMSLWGYLAQAIAKLLGIGPKEQNLFGSVLESTTAFVEQGNISGLDYTGMYNAYTEYHPVPRGHKHFFPLREFSVKAKQIIKDAGLENSVQNLDTYFNVRLIRHSLAHLSTLIMNPALEPVHAQLIQLAADMGFDVNQPHDPYVRPWVTAEFILEVNTQVLGLSLPEQLDLELSQLIDTIDGPVGVQRVYHELLEYSSSEAKQVAEILANEAVKFGIDATQKPEKTEGLTPEEIKDSTYVTHATYSSKLLQSQPARIFVYSGTVDNSSTAGQAVIRDEENSMSIPVKHTAGRDAGAFFSDTTLTKNMEIIDKAIADIIAKGKPIVFPVGGIGTGMSELSYRAPKTFEYLNKRLNEAFGIKNTPVGIDVETSIDVPQLAIGLASFIEELQVRISAGLNGIGAAKISQLVTPWIKDLESTTDLQEFRDIYDAIRKNGSVEARMVAKEIHRRAKEHNFRLPNPDFNPINRALEDVTSELHIESDETYGALSLHLKDKLGDNIPKTEEQFRTWFMNTNLVDFFFEHRPKDAQEGVNGNPLGTIDNYIDTLAEDLDLALSHLKQDHDLTDPQIRQLSALVHYKQKYISPVINKLFKKKDSYKFQDYMQYLVKGDTIDSRLMDAFTVTTFEWLQTSAQGTLFNDDKAIRRILGLDKSAPVTPEMRENLQFAGLPLNLVVEDLGRAVLNNLELKALPSAPKNMQPMLQTSLGLFALRLLELGNFIHGNQVAASTLSSIVKDTLYAAELNRHEAAVEFSEDATEAEKARIALESAKIRFVKAYAHPDNKFELADTVAVPSNASKNAQNTVSRLFQTERLADRPLLDKPEPRDSRRISGSHQQVAKEVNDVLNKHNARENYVNKGMHLLTQHMTELELATMMGYEEDLTKHQKFFREGVEANNERILLSIRNWREFTENDLQNNIDTPFYFEWEQWKNLRLGIKSSLVNPQTDKFHRHMLALGGQTQTLSKSDPAQMEYFNMAIAQGLGIGIDKQPNEKSLHQLKNVLELIPIANAIEEARKAVRGEKYDNSIILAGVKEAGEKAHSLHAIIAYAEFLESEGDTFTTDYTIEADGVTNGPAIGTIQFAPHADWNILKARLKRVGMQVEGDTEGYATWKDTPGNDDNYQVVVRELHAQLGKLLDEEDTAHLKPAIPFIDLVVGDLISSDNMVTKDGRNYVKDLVMAAIYGAGTKGLANAMARQVLANFYLYVQKNTNNQDALKTVFKLLLQTPYVGKTFTADQLNSLLTNPMNFRLTTDQERGILRMASESHGRAATNAINFTFPEIIKNRTIVNAALNISYYLFKNQFDYLVAERKAQLVAEGKFFSARMDLPQGEIDHIMNRLIEAQPIMANFFSKASGNLKEGTYAGKTSKPTILGDRSPNSKDRKLNQLSNEYLSLHRTEQVYGDGMESMLGATSGTTGRGVKRLYAVAPIRELAPPGVSPAVLMVQSVDAASMIQQLMEWDVLNVHDAIFVDAKNAIKALQAMNENFTRVHTNLSIVGEALKTLERSLEIAREFDARLNMTGENSIAFAGEDIRKFVGTTLQMPITDRFELEMGISRIHSNTLGAARTIEMSKEALLARITTMNQYYLQDGGYVSKVNELLPLRPETTPPQTVNRKKRNERYSTRLEKIRNKEQATNDAIIARTHKDLVKNIGGNTRTKIPLYIPAETTQFAITADKNYAFAGSNARKIADAYDSMGENTFLNTLASDLAEEGRQQHNIGVSTAVETESLPEVEAEPKVLDLPNLNAPDTTDVLDNTTMMGVFEGLGSVGRNVDTPQHTAHLRELMNEIAVKVHNPLKLEYTKDTKMKVKDLQDNEIYTYVNIMEPSKDITARGLHSMGLRVSNQEAMAHSMVYTILESQLRTNSVYRSELQRIYDLVRQYGIITPEMFDTYGSKEQQQKAFDYYLTIKPGNSVNYLAEFAALALTNAKIGAALANSGIPTSYTNKRWKGKTFSETIRNTFNRTADIILHRSSGIAAGTRLDIATKRLALSLIRREAEQRNIFLSAASKTFKSVGNFLDTTVDTNIRKLVDKVAKSERLAKSRWDVLQASRKLAQGNFDKAIDLIEFIKLGRAEQGEQEGFWGTLLTSMLGTTTSTKQYHIMSMEKNQAIDTARKDVEATTVRALRNAFKMPLTQEHKDGITKAGLKTDLSSILDVAPTANIIRALKDPSALKAEIKNLQKQLIDGSENGIFYVNGAQSLGYYMATGMVNTPHLLMNAENIAALLGVPGKQHPEGYEKWVKTIDALSTMYALEHTAENHKLALANVMENDIEGFKFAMDMHSLLKKQIREDLYKGREHRIIKGHIDDVADKNTDIAFSTEANAKDLLARGYHKAALLPMDPRRSNKEPVYAYVNKFGAPTAFAAGIISLTSTKQRGSDTTTYDKRTDATNGAVVGMSDTSTFTSSRASMTKVLSTKLLTINPKSQASFAIPMLDKVGKTYTYRYAVPEGMKDVTLGKDNSFDTTLGLMASRRIDQIRTPEVNQEVLEALAEQYELEKEYYPDAFLEIHAKSKDPILQEYWATLPEGAKQAAKKLFPSGKIMIRKDLVRTVFGYREISVSDAFGLAEAQRNVAQEALVHLASTVLGPQAEIRLRRAGHMWQEYVAMAKDYIVVRSGVVTLANAASNTLQLQLHGVALEDIVRNQAVAYREAHKFFKLRDELSRLQLLQAMGRKVDVQRINRLEQEILANPAAPLVSSGLLQTIVDDVNLQSETSILKTTVLDFVERHGGKHIDALPEKLRKAAKELVVSDSSKTRAVLAEAAQLSDFVARYTLVKHLTENEGMSHANAVAMALDAFVNYQIPEHEIMQYLNKMGLVWFTKYYFRVQKTAIKALTSRPSRAILQMASANLTGAPSILDSALSPDGITNRVTLPTDPVSMVLDSAYARAAL